MRSQSARPSSDSRSSQQILPTVRISLTPGAAVATKSNARAMGPMRPNTGTRACTLRYSRSEDSVSICIANTPGCTWRGSKPTGACSNRAVRLFLASTSTSRTFLPWSAARSAVAAVTVLLPTPPFPVKKSSRRSSSPVIPPQMGVGLAAEADALVGPVFVDLDVGDPAGRDADATTLDVGQPHHRGVAGQRLVDGFDDLVGGSVELERELLGRVDDTDVNFHAAESSGRPVCPSPRTPSSNSVFEFWRGARAATGAAVGEAPPRLRLAVERGYRGPPRHPRVDQPVFGVVVEGIGGRVLLGGADERVLAQPAGGA